MEAAITKEDAIITGYRDHCQQLARGDSTYRITAELVSKATGSTQGKGGSMHLYSKENNFYGGTGVVGQQVMSYLPIDTCRHGNCVRHEISP
jgi:pyruvate dehydrogenase E1 component alpha subunit